MIYLDHNATAPVDPKVLASALPYFQDKFGNPSSAHLKGYEAKKGMMLAREQVASALGASPEEIIFTSGGSESNNLVLKGTFLAPELFCKGHLVISVFEHAAISNPAKYLERLGVDVSVIPCSSSGRINPQDVAKALRPDTRLVSIMHANNEIGTIQPISEISDLCKSQDIPLHSDASQSVGKTAVNVDELGVDFLTIAGHKVYAPKGIGALYIRKNRKLHPLIQGVDHEGGMRAGTENVPYQVALGAAMQLAEQNGPQQWARMEALRNRLFALLKEGIGSKLTQNGSSVPRLPNTLSVNFPDATGTAVLQGCPNICASTSAACHSGQHTQTVTQKAIGLPPDIAAGTVRLSLGWHTTEADIDNAAKALIQSWKQYRTS